LTDKKTGPNAKTARARARGTVRIIDKNGKVKSELNVTDVELMETDDNADRRHNNP
jgi:hypothetical protein